MGNFQPFEVVDRGSETQPQVVENLNKFTLQDKGYESGVRESIEKEKNNDRLFSETLNGRVHFPRFTKHR